MASTVADIPLSSATTADDHNIHRIPARGAYNDDNCCQVPADPNPFPPFDTNKSKPVTMVKLRRLWTRQPKKASSKKPIDDHDFSHHRLKDDDDSTINQISAKKSPKKENIFRSFSPRSVDTKQPRLDSGSNSEHHISDKPSRQHGVCFCDDDLLLGTTPVSTPAHPPTATDDDSSVLDVDSMTSQGSTMSARKSKKKVYGRRLVQFKQDRSDMATATSPRFARAVENDINTFRFSMDIPTISQDENESNTKSSQPKQRASGRYFSFEPLKPSKGTSVPFSPFLSPFTHDSPSLLCSPSCPGHFTEGEKAPKKSHRWISCKKIACFSPQAEAVEPKVHYYGGTEGGSYYGTDGDTEVEHSSGGSSTVADVHGRKNEGDYSVPASEAFYAKKPHVSHDDDSGGTFVFHSFASDSDKSGQSTHHSASKQTKSHSLKGNLKPSTFSAPKLTGVKMYGSSTLSTSPYLEQDKVASTKGFPIKVLSLFFGPVVAIGSQLLSEIRVHKVDTWRGPNVVCMYPGGFGVVLGAPLGGSSDDEESSQMDSSMEEGSLGE